MAIGAGSETIIDSVVIRRTRAGSRGTRRKPQNKVPQLSRVLNMNQMPDWVQSLFEAVGSTIEFKGLANLEARFSAADETAWGTDLLEIRPAVVDLADHGLTVGEVAYGIIHAFDLKAVVEMFDGIAAFSFGIE